MDPAAPLDFMATDDLGLEPVLTVGPKNRTTPVAARPKKTWVLSEAEAIKAMHDLRLAQAREYAEWLTHDRIGHFEADEDDIANNVIETMPMDSIVAEHVYNVGLIALMDLFVSLLNRETTETEEALAIEDAVHFLFQCEERQHQRAYGSLLRWTEPDHLQRFGCLVGLDTVNPDNHECGLDMSLIDPLTVFPVWEGRNGLGEVFRVYEDTVANIAGNYGNGDPKEAKRLESTLKKMTGKSADSAGRPDRLKRVTVTELWNRDWVQVIVDDRELLTRRHGYGRVPFTVTIGGFDLPPGVTSGMAKEPYDLNTIWGEIPINDASTDLARQYRPYAWKRLKTHAIKEAVYGRLLTAFKDARDPAGIYEYDPMTKHLNTGDMKARPGHVLEVPLGNRYSTISTAPGADVATPLFQGLAENATLDTLTLMRTGGVPPQTTGTALGKMLELGAADRAVLVAMVSAFKKQRAEWRLELWRDWGHALTTGQERGVLAVPNRASSYGQSPMHVLTPETLERAGCYLDLTLHRFSPDPGLAQFVSTLRAPAGATGAPLFADETLRRTVRLVPDPDREGYRIENEMLYANPAIATQRALRRIDEEVAREIEAGDERNADALMVSGIELDYVHQQQVMSGQAAPLPEPPAPGGAPGDVPAPAPTPPQPAMNQQGLSMPDMGVGVGQQGGRPQQPTAPTPPVRPVQATQQR